MKKLLLSLGLITSFTFIGGCDNKSSSDLRTELNIYSSRKEEFLIDLLETFSKKYKVKINTKNDTDVYKLIESIKSSRTVSDKRLDADLLITADVSSMNYAKEEGLLEQSSCEIYKDIDKFFLDGDCYWSALSFRARIIAYSKEHLDERLSRELNNYLDVAKTDRYGKYVFGKRMIFTPISSPYNQFWLAYLMEIHDEETVSNFVKELMGELKYDNPSGTDTGKLEDLAFGRGHIALVNSYYYFRKAMPVDSTKTQEELKKIGDDFKSKVGIIFPNQPDIENSNQRGTSINFSAIGLVKNGSHKEIAEKFIEFMLSDEAQEIILKNNHEYSVTLKDLNKELNKNVTEDEIVFDNETNLIDVSKNVKTILGIAKQNNWS